MRRIAVVGCGMVGSATALRIAEAGLADEVVVVDADTDLAAGVALDANQAMAALGGDTTVTHGWDDADQAGLVVICAGQPRRPGQSRADLASGNAQIIIDIASHVRRRAPDAVVIVVTNPLDEMTTLAQRVLGFDPQRVIGMAGGLDSARLRAFIAARAGVPVSSVEALTLGSHGDLMVPLLRLARVGATPLTDVLSASDIDAICERTRNGGAEIVALMRRGSAFLAPSVAITDIARAVSADQRRVLAVCAFCDAAFGIRQTYVGVTARIGRGGVIDVVDVGLDGAEQAQLRAAADEVRRRVAALDALITPAASEQPVPVVGIADLVAASQIRTTARQALARRGRLDQLEQVVQTALRRQQLARR